MAKAGPEITVRVLDLPEVRALVAELNVEHVRLAKVEAAAIRVVQLATRDNVIATHAAIAELRRALDGGGT